MCRKMVFPADIFSIIQAGSPFVLLDTARPLGDEQNSYLFHDPVDILTAFGPDDVSCLYSKVEHALDQGLYVAGWWSYEWGYALIPRLNHLLHVHCPEGPLVWLGVFERPVVWKASCGLSMGHTVDSGVMPGPLAGVFSDGPRLDTGRSEFMESVRAVQDYIRQGDTYQVNYTVRSRFSFAGDPFELYLRLRSVQAVSYGAVIRTDDRWVLSLSPELFFHREHERIWSKPMKGTVARGKTPEQDRALRGFLENDLKNRAENVMIVDLLRNDLGMIAQTGSVRVPQLFHVEAYETLFQMISRIEARLREDVGWIDIFQALFPCGSITGAPKLRTMEIISELETSPRGIYTGSIGFMSPDNHAVFNVTIRTLELFGNRGVMGIGSGITIGSDPAAEYEETRLKARFLQQVVMRDAA